MMSHVRPIPEHLRPDSCYVCGWPRDVHAEAIDGDGHKFWSNAEALAHFAKEPRGSVAAAVQAAVDEHANGGYGS